MEVFDKLVGIGDVRGRLPRVFFKSVSNPLDKILKVLLSEEARVENLLDFIDFAAIIVKFGVGTRVLRAFLDFVARHGAKKRDVEDGVYAAKRTRKREAVDEWRYDFFDGVRAEPLVVELLCGAARLDIFAAKPYLLTDFEHGRIS